LSIIHHRLGRVERRLVAGSRPGEAGGPDFYRVVPDWRASPEAPPVGRQAIFTALLMLINLAAYLYFFQASAMMIGREYLPV
jgi:hypothetical protein